MKLRIEQLNQHLSKQLAPIYLVSGDEYCLVDEAVSTIRLKAKQQGFTERETITIDTRFNWHSLLDKLNTLSLFASQKTVEIHLPTGKPGDAGSKFMQQYGAQINNDIVLILILPKVESAATKSKWWQAVDAAGVTLQIWPLDTKGIRLWITQQLQEFDLQLDTAAIEFLITQTQGNLLATKQEIQKLSLLFTRDTLITQEALCEVLQDNTEYTIFDLVDSCNNGDAPTALKILEKLQMSGIEPILIIWALTREIRQLHAMQQSLQNGTSITAVLQQYRLALSRKSAVEKALRRLTQQQHAQVISSAAEIDAIIKGNHQAGLLWPSLSQLCLSYCGYT